MLLIIIAILEVFSATLLSTIPHHKNIPAILGTLVAQETSVPPTNQPDSSPSPAATPENPATDANTPPPQDPFAITSQGQYPQDISPTTPPQETQAQTSADQNPANPETAPPANSPDVQENTVDFTQSQTSALLAPQDILSNPDALSDDLQEKVQGEENQIEKQPAGEEKAKLLLNFSQDKINDLNQSLTNDDFASANFTVLRLDDQVKKTLENAVNSQNLMIEIKAFCKKADFSLRSAELVVPENSEQDFEITRGTCLSIQL